MAGLVVALAALAYVFVSSPLNTMQSPAAPTSSTSAPAAEFQSVPEPDTQRSVERQNRVIVVGAGLAGMTAALELNRLGVDVVLIEREKNAGGNSAKASSGMNAVGTDVQTKGTQTSPRVEAHCLPALRMLLMTDDLVSRVHSTTFRAVATAADDSVELFARDTLESCVEDEKGVHATTSPAAASRPSVPPRMQNLVGLLTAESKSAYEFLRSAGLCLRFARHDVRIPDACVTPAAFFSRKRNRRGAA